MKTGDAFALIDHEHDADDGLLTQFRMNHENLIKEM